MYWCYQSDNGRMQFEHKNHRSLPQLLLRQAF